MSCESSVGTLMTFYYDDSGQREYVRQLQATNAAYAANAVNETPSESTTSLLSVQALSVTSVSSLSSDHSYVTFHTYTSACFDTNVKKKIEIYLLFYLFKNNQPSYLTTSQHNWMDGQIEAVEQSKPPRNHYNGREELSILTL